MISAVLFLIAGIVGAIPVPHGNQIAWVLVAIAGVLMLVPIR